MALEVLIYHYTDVLLNDWDVDKKTITEGRIYHSLEVDTRITERVFIPRLGVDKMTIEALDDWHVDTTATALGLIDHSEVVKGPLRGC